METISLKKKLFKKSWLILIVVATLLLIKVIFFAGTSTHQAFKFILPGYPLNSTDNRVNILLLGIAGGIHDGANLTDTIMVASYSLKENKVYLISIPRDFWLDQTKSKINAVYEIGLEKGNGLGLAKQAIGDMLGLPIHYSLRLDFNGFVKAVDLVGGLDINIDKSFDDYLYPITGKENDLCGFTEEDKDFNLDEAKSLNIQPGKQKVFISPDGQIATDSANPDKGHQYFSCRFEHLSFTSGQTHMDGITALKFVRSRMGTNGEGSDFARSKRQQKVLDAFRIKVLSLDTLGNPTKIKQLIQQFGQSFETDISAGDILDFYQLTKKVTQTINISLDDSKALGLLINPPPDGYGGAYVLVPISGNYDNIHQYIESVLSGKNNEATPSARTSN